MDFDETVIEHQKTLGQEMNQMDYTFQQVYLRNKMNYRRL